MPPKTRMSLITKMRKQDAIYWPPAGSDDYGQPVQGALVELVVTDAGNYRVRWEDAAQEFSSADGSTLISNSLVYVPQLPDGSDVVVGGFLWLGTRADLTNEGDPRAAGGAEVRRVDKTPNLKATELLRVVYL